eukprot:m51a1_g6100 putative t-complex protein 1 subunit zeta (554) ;mRNA; f:69207-71554
MSGVKVLNKQAEVSRRDQALIMNIGAARGLQEVVKSNLGPKGTIKMLVSGAGDIKITKDGNVLMHEMQIQHPTAHLIARAATAQDDITGDGTTTNVLLIGELMRQSERYLSDGVHPRVLTEGFEVAKTRALEFLDQFKVPLDMAREREMLLAVARTSLRTKLSGEVADTLAESVVDAVLTVRPGPGQAADLHMVEVMHMRHRLATETRLVRGLVLDHGARHHDMPKAVDDAYVLTCNVSMEYEKSEVNSSLFYSNVEQRVELAAAERRVTDETVARVCELKRRLCGPGRETQKHFVVINQKGIDPPSLQALADEGIVAIRRAKRRNMERLTLACGGVALNSIDADIDESALGHAGRVYEQVLGEDKYTFIEGCPHPTSCTILVKGPDDHTINQIKDAVRDGLRAVNNAIADGAVVPGAGAFEVACSARLAAGKASAPGRSKLGVDVFAQALLVVPKVLSENAGHDAIDTVLALQDAVLEAEQAGRRPVAGVDLDSGKPFDSAAAGVWDNYCVKKQVLQAASVVATQLLLVDVIMRAGKAGAGGQRMPEGGPME